MTLPLPEEQRAKLLALAAPPAVGDIWLVPRQHVRFPGGKPRRCLLVALEPSDKPVRAHLIAGTGSPGPPPARVVAEPDELNGLEKTTYFKFQDPVEDFELLELQTVAVRIGQVADDSLAAIPSAIAASNLAALKRLTMEQK